MVLKAFFGTLERVKVAWLAWEQKMEASHRVLSTPWPPAGSGCFQKHVL